MEVPQSKPLPGTVPNSAGGFTWAVDDMRRLRRFLCLGSEGGTYYIGEKKLGKENAQCISRLIGSGRGRDVVSEILDFSLQGRAAKQDPIVFALALCARGGDKETKRVSYEALNKVCRIPTHLFAFVDFCESLSQGGTGWGRAQRRAVQAWYNEKKGKPLAIAVTKYRQRGGWSHLDLLRLCHLVPANEGVGCVCRYVVKGIDVCREGFAGKGEAEVDEILVFLGAVEAAKSADEPTIVKFIQENGLVREHVPTAHLNSTVVSSHISVSKYCVLRNGLWRVAIILCPYSQILQDLKAYEKGQTAKFCREEYFHPKLLLHFAFPLYPLSEILGHPIFNTPFRLFLLSFKPFMFIIVIIICVIVISVHRCGVLYWRTCP